MISADISAAIDLSDNSDSDKSTLQAGDVQLTLRIHKDVNKIRYDQEKWDEMEEELENQDKKYDLPQRIGDE